MEFNLMSILCGGGLVIGLFVGGVAAVILGFRARKKGEASNSWPSADGIITNAWIEENTDYDDDGFSSTTYTPKWQYTFYVGGNEYTNDRISYGASRGYGRHSKAQEELERYPANSRVRVYYDPNDLKESVLVRGAKGTLVGVIIGIILIIASILVACGGGLAAFSNF